jgi:diacylglycerol kinase (ATP)
MTHGQAHASFVTQSESLIHLVERSIVPTNSSDSFVNPQKGRTGLSRWWHATKYSVDGLQAGWYEPAFRQEMLAAAVMLPLACWIGNTWVETAVLVSTVVLVMIVELLNTAIETTIDRIGPQWHDLSKKAKDMGSAAVLLSLLLCGGVWATAIWQLYRRLI